MISFKASYISTTNILQYKNLKSYPQQVSFVELNPHDERDVLNANYANLDWNENSGKNRYFGYDICQALNTMYGSKTPNTDKRFFAITSQLDNFQDLISNKILALAYVVKCNDKTQYIEYLQVAPKNSYNAKSPEYRYIGTAMLESLKKLFSDKNIELDAVSQAVKFYLKNGFKDLGENAPYERKMLFESIVKKV